MSKSLVVKKRSERMKRASCWMNYLDVVANGGLVVELKRCAILLDHLLQLLCADGKISGHPVLMISCRKVLVYMPLGCGIYIACATGC